MPPVMNGRKGLAVSRATRAVIDGANARALWPQSSQAPPPSIANHGLTSQPNAPPATAALSPDVPAPPPNTFSVVPWLHILPSGTARLVADGVVCADAVAT